MKGGDAGDNMAELGAGTSLGGHLLRQGMNTPQAQGGWSISRDRWASERHSQVGDMGIDGRIFPVSALENRRKTKDGELGLEEKFYPWTASSRTRWGEGTSNIQ